MPLAQEVPARLRQRCCLVCGYDGPELQGRLTDGAYRCPACDADLYARPPRSYAELEGFVLGASAAEDARAEGPPPVEIKVRRSIPVWLVRLLARLRRPARRG